MPVLKRIGPYRFLCYAADGSEPPHVHVVRESSKAKFWLDPAHLESNDGFAAVELRKVRRLVEANEQELLKAWYDFFGTEAH
jgi:hypothetical protein